MDIKANLEDIVSQYAVDGKDYIHQSRVTENNEEVFWFEEVVDFFNLKVVTKDRQWTFDFIPTTHFNYYIISWLKEEEMSAVFVKVLREDAEAAFDND